MEKVSFHQNSQTMLILAIVKNEYKLKCYEHNLNNNRIWPAYFSLQCCMVNAYYSDIIEVGYCFVFAATKSVGLNNWNRQRGIAVKFLNKKWYQALYMLFKPTDISNFVINNMLLFLSTSWNKWKTQCDVT